MYLVVFDPSSVDEDVRGAPLEANVDFCPVHLSVPDGATYFHSTLDSAIKLRDTMKKEYPDTIYKIVRV